jgi:hypothetical protein
MKKKKKVKIINNYEKKKKRFILFHVFTIISIFNKISKNNPYKVILLFIIKNYYI